MGGGGVDKFTDFLPFRNSSSKIVTAGSDTYLNYPGLTLSSTAGGAKVRGDKILFWQPNAGPGLGRTMLGLPGDVQTNETTGGPANGTTDFTPTPVRPQV